MPRRALHCTVDISIHAVSCPGVWLPRRDDLFLRITIFNQVQQTQLTSPVFPLLFHEKFRFEKTFYSAFEPSQIADRLQDDNISVELIQLSDCYEEGKLLAYSATCARDFLFPYPSYSTNYGTQDRELLLERILDFPGIAPKLEFTTSTLIKEATSKDVQQFSEGDLPVRYGSPSPRSTSSKRRSHQSGRRTHRGLFSNKTPGYQQATIASITRSRSCSPTLARRLDSLSLSERVYDYLSRPPFVIKKLESRPLSASILGRKSPVSSRSNKARRASLPPSSQYMNGCSNRHSARKYPYYEVMPGYDLTTDESDLDKNDPYKSPNVRYSSPRPPNPLTYRPTLQDRFDERPWSATTSEKISSQVRSALRWNSSVDNLDYLDTNYNTSNYTTDSLEGYDSLDELADDFEKARYRRYYE